MAFFSIVSIPATRTYFYLFFCLFVFRLYFIYLYFQRPKAHLISLHTPPKIRMQQWWHLTEKVDGK